ncbi:hypothetical protein ABC382_00645 [Lysinibacillus sp. 1P01SD]|uniref:hypothetical protein n=1 Tax=Lysinibacillus sp. 1P01SD TaxID=3132285 RepID=UPI0039A29186
MIVNNNLIQMYNLSVLSSEKKIILSNRIIYRLKNSNTNEIPIYVSVPISYQILEIVIAYLLFKVREVYEVSTLILNDIVMLLVDCFDGIIELETTGVPTIDLHDNYIIWSNHKKEIINLNFLTLNNNKDILNSLISQFGHDCNIF